MTLPEFPRWDLVPDHLKTKTQLGKLGLKPAKGQRAVAVKTHWKYNVPDYALYDMADAVPKRRCSPAQLAALEKARKAARTCPVCSISFSYRGWRVPKWKVGGCHSCWIKEERRVAISWAREVLADPAAIILDTETTGLDGDAEIISIAATLIAGQTLLDTLIKPLGDIPAEATAVHGIIAEDVAQAQTWPSVHGEVLALIAQASRVVTYNADFDYRLLCQTFGAMAWAASMRISLNVRCRGMPHLSESCTARYEFRWWALIFVGIEHWVIVERRWACSMR